MADYTPAEEYNDIGDGFRSSGKLFSYRDQCLCLNIFSRRFTGDHPPNWASAEKPEGHDEWPLQFLNDEEWLANTNFATTPSGNLDKRGKKSLGKPTWPNKYFFFWHPLKN